MRPREAKDLADLPLLPNATRPLVLSDALFVPETIKNVFQVSFSGSRHGECTPTSLYEVLVIVVPFCVAAHLFKIKGERTALD